MNRECYYCGRLGPWLVKILSNGARIAVCPRCNQ